MRATKGTVGTRVRLQRVRDAKFFGGWTVSNDEAHFVVKLSSGHGIEVGERFFFQVYSSKKCLVFPGDCVKVGNDIVHFTIQGRPRILDSNEEVRLRASHIRCAIKTVDSDRLVEVLDISQEGIGISSPVQFANGEELNLVLEFSDGQVKAIGEVRNCRKQPDGFGFRVGMTITIADRSMQGRWRNQFFEAA